MNRRNFLKFFSAIPLIGIPIKLLAEPDAYGVIEISEGQKALNPALDPYEDVAEHVYKPYWNDSKEMNEAWMKRIS